MDNDLYKVLPKSTDNLESLEKWKDEYDGIPYENKLRSDDMSTEIYGIDNMTRYNRIKAILSDDVDPNDPGNNTFTQEASIMTAEEEDFYNGWEDKLERAKQAEASGLIIMVDTNKELHGEDTEDSINLLKEKWDKFQLLPEELRTLSNNTAYNIFGMDNYKLYEKILNNHLKDLDDQANGLEKYTSPNTVIRYGSNVAPYATDDDADYISSDMVEENSYTWIKSLEELYLDLSHAKSINEANEIKSKISKLGWNPEIPFSESAAERTWVLNSYTGNAIEIDAKEYLKEATKATSKVKHTYEELKDKIIPIFVCLTSGISNAGKIIRWFTDSKWSHASIGFKSSLNPMYSFNLYFGQVNGFSIEGLKTYMKMKKDRNIKVYALFVTPEQRDKMKEAIQWYIDNKDKTKYNLSNIFAIALRRISKSASDKDKMICSQFVYSILKLADFKTRKTKENSTITPADIDELADDARFFVMYEGDMETYNSEEVDKLCKAIIPTLPLEYYGIDEATGIELFNVKSAIKRNSTINRVFEMAEALLKNK